MLTLRSDVLNWPWPMLMLEQAPFIHPFLILHQPTILMFLSPNHPSSFSCPIIYAFFQPSTQPPLAYLSRDSPPTLFIHTFIHPFFHPNTPLYISLSSIKPSIPPSSTFQSLGSFMSPRSHSVTYLFTHVFIQPADCMLHLWPSSVASDMSMSYSLPSIKISWSSAAQ